MAILGVHPLKVGRIACLLTLFCTVPAGALPMWVSVKQMGATFLEVPPGRDVALAPIASVTAQPRIETHVIATFGNRVVTDVPVWGPDSKVNAIAVLVNKKYSPIGPAQVGAFRRVSEDRTRTLFSISVTRLPDKPVSGVQFVGTVRVNVARRVARKSLKFTPKVGARLDLGLGIVKIGAADASSITLGGGERLGWIASMKLTKADGRVVTGQRGAYARRGGGAGAAVQSHWDFTGPIGPGKLDVTVYEAVEAVNVPVDLIVAKPY